MDLENPATLAYRLSPIQEQVWAHERTSVGQPYRVFCALKLEGNVDADRLRDSISRVVAAHEILRTTYPRQPGMTSPFQVISDAPAFAWEVVNGANGALFENLKTRPFDFEHAPALSAVLVDIASEKHTLLLSLPAMAADASTLLLLAKEIAREYSGAGAATEGEIMQFVDVAEWQHELLQSEDTKAGHEYWRDFWRAADISQISSFSLPFENAGQDFLPAVVSVVLDSHLAERIEAIAKQQNSTAQDFLLASWQVLLSRITGRSDITVGARFDSRRHEELKRTLGALSKTLPVSSQLDAHQAFCPVMAKARETCREIGMWQDTFSWSESAEGSHHLPIAFEFIDLGGPVEAGDVRMQIAQLYSCTEPCKIKLVVVRGTAGHALEFHYDRSRFGEEVISRLGAQFRMLLASAVAHPEKPIGELAILPAEERQRLLVEWNRTERAYPAGETMVSLFEAQAAKTPERIAVAGAGKQLTYAELNGRANQLAHALRGQGVGPDSGVGLCLDRSADLLVAILGIFKAGGAYVPLNPEHPRARLEQQLAGAKALVTESAWLESAGRALLSDLPAISGAVICLDRDADKLSQQPATNPAAVAKPENLAYVIYTSGSTGVPKGVEIEHRNLANYARFLAERLELEKYPEGLGFATVSTIAADLGNTCIYPALVSGGTLHLVSHDEATDTARLGRYMDEHGIDVLKIVPSHLSALLASEEGRKVLPRKYLITGGEALTQRLLDRIAQLQATCEVINHYGPTETTVGSLTLKLNEHAAGKWDSPAIPIGRPIANTRVYILDARLQPVPIGAVGELYISGAGVGRGYRGQPRMTAECFLQDPFADDPGARMYRTGDLARYLEDGNIEFLGRSDDQVKVRGFRIELGEIEAALASHASVKQAVVLAREDEQSGDKRLVGYAVLHREKPTTVEDLRQHLRTQLPDYMVPGALLILDKLPLNANGKVDRQGLPSPQAAGPANQRPYVAPRTPVEEVVTNIWAEVLRVPQVGADDNFFELGGHSLLATQVVSRIREHFNVELALRSLFEKPTVNALASEIETVREGAAHSEPNPITRASRERYRITTNQG